MGMDMKMGFVLQQKQELTLKHSISILHRITLTQVRKLNDILVDLRSEVEPDDQRLVSALDETFLKMSQVIGTEQTELMREVFDKLFFGKGKLFFQQIIEKSVPVIFDGKAGVRDLTARLLAKTLKMSAGANDIQELSEGEIAAVLQNPNPLIIKIAELKKLTKTLGKEKGMEGTIRELGNAENLMRLYDAYKDEYENDVEFIELLLGFPSEKENPLRKALVDIYMLNQAGFLISERLLKRFAAVFSRAKKDLNFEKLSIGAANIIGEYMLVGMGVIDPEIFKLMSGEANHNEDETIVDRQQRKRTGDLIEKYGLKNGKFFYNRYATLGTKPGLRTDNIIRDFLTIHIREVRTELCTGVDLQSLINGLLIDLEDDLEEEEVGENLMRNIAEALASEKFKKCMSKVMKDSLLPKFIHLITGKNLGKSELLPSTKAL